MKLRIIRQEEYQSGNQNPSIEDGETAQCPKEKGQKNKQRSTKHTHKTKDRVTRTLRKPGRKKTKYMWHTKPFPTSYIVVLSYVE